ncbi:MAG TPA: hypothetical protein PKI03_30865 [Pseudomonadota bacterium]|nr:hypothetical protein [Pseudomonadota bacterium]
MHRQVIPLLALAPLLLSCAAANLREQVREQQTQIQELRTQLAEVNDEIVRLRDTVNQGFQALYGRLDCSDQRVKDFLSECEKGSETCSPQGVANALAFMENQAPAFCMLRGDTRMGSLLPIREGGLMQLADPKHFRPTTRFVVLVQPRAETPDAFREAKLVGQDLIDFLRKKLDIPAKIRILGPMTLPCKSKQDQLGGYISRIARPLPGESIDKAARVKVFVYRTEC